MKKIILILTLCAIFVGTANSQDSNSQEQANPETPDNTYDLIVKSELLQYFVVPFATENFTFPLNVTLEGRWGRIGTEARALFQPYFNLEDSFTTGLGVGFNWYIINRPIWDGLYVSLGMDMTTTTKRYYNRSGSDTVYSAKDLVINSDIGYQFLFGGFVIGAYIGSGYKIIDDVNGKRKVSIPDSSTTTLDAFDFRYGLIMGYAFSVKPITQRPWWIL